VEVQSKEYLIIAANTIPMFWIHVFQMSLLIHSYVFSVLYFLSTIISYSCVFPISLFFISAFQTGLKWLAVAT
jgi:hypothetical protein